MRRHLFSLFILISTLTYGQDQVVWEFKVVDDQFVATATIAEGWHLYSQHINNDIGPIPTEFTFEENKQIKLIGNVNEPESLKEYDANFEGELNFFKDSVAFQQKIKYEKGAQLDGYVTFMVCNATMCLPPRDEKFEITLN